MPGNDWTKLSTGGLFIGAFDHLQYEQETLALQSGDVLVAFTDGVTEAMNTAGEEFDDARLQAVVTECAARSADDICPDIVARVRQWSAGAPQSDDLTLLVLKVR